MWVKTLPFEFSLKFLMPSPKRATLSNQQAIGDLAAAPSPCLKVQKQQIARHHARG
jgi:hypothetical protein